MGDELLTTAHSVLRCGLALMLAAAGIDTFLAIVDGAPVHTVLEGVVLFGLAAGGMSRPDLTARFLRPPGRTALLAALFAAAGALDGGIQTHYAGIGPALVWFAAVVSSRRWFLVTLLVSCAGYVGGLWLHGLSLDDEAGVVLTQLADYGLSGGAGLLAVSILRRFLAGIPGQLEDVRAGGPSLTPQLAAAARGGIPLTLPRADPVALVAPLTPAEHAVVERLAAGMAPKQIALELGIALPTVRSHIAAAKRKTGARTLGQLVALFTEAGVVV